MAEDTEKELEKELDALDALVSEMKEHGKECDALEAALTQPKE